MSVLSELGGGIIRTIPTSSTAPEANRDPRETVKRLALERITLSTHTIYFIHFGHQNIIHSKQSLLPGTQLVSWPLVFHVLYSTLRPTFVRVLGNTRETRV